MCMPRTPRIDAPPPPPQAQDVKEPDSVATRRQRRQQTTLQPGSILTSPSGVANSALNTGGGSILGG